MPLQVLVFYGLGGSHLRVLICRCGTFFVILRKISDSCAMAQIFSPEMTEKSSAGARLRRLYIETY
ncbi:MAG: hypothetical protein K2F77_00250, partial [Muribaculaceae bacterium]|nr:hypothetical protein [Muribaculaceae bacterium]